MPTWPSPSSERLGTPKIPAIRFPRGTSFGASRFTYATACQVARPPLTDRTRSPRPQRAFTSRLPAVWSPSLPLGITTTWTGLLVLAGLAPAGMAASLAAPEPCVNFSAHTAPIRQTCRSCRSASERRGSSYPVQVVAENDGADFVCLEALELPHRPSEKRQIDVPEHRRQCRRRVAPVVFDPPAEERVELAGDVGQRQLCPLPDVQVPDRRP